MKKKKTARIVALISLVIVFATSILASCISSDFGNVKVMDIKLVTEQNLALNAKLWIPKDASEESPLPALVMSHGYSAHYNNMVGLSLEFARRGYVVIAYDAYGMGYSELNDGITQPEWDDGAYAALQYLGNLPQVDENRIGMIGHSRGNLWNQNAAITAWRNHDSDPTVIVPRSLMLISFSFTPIEKLSNGSFGYALTEYPVSVGTIFGEYDEFAASVWNTRPEEYTKAVMFGMGAGVRDVTPDIYFVFGNATPLSRSEAAAAAEAGNLRAAFSYPNTHIIAVFDDKPIGDTIDFMDITLRGGESTVDRDDQVWFGRQSALFFGFFGFFVFVISLGVSLVDTSFFSTIVRPQPKSMNTLHSVKDGIAYGVIFLLLQVPMLTLYFYLSGWPGIIKVWQPLPQGPYFSAPGLNPTVLLDLIISAILILVVFLVYTFIGKKNGSTLDNLGFNIPAKQIGKAVLLAITTFGIAYAVLCIIYTVTGTFVSFLEFDIIPMNGIHWAAFFKYLPFWLLMNLVNGVVFNSVTRVNNAKEWVNYLLIILGSSLAVLILLLVQYISLYTTGTVAIETSAWHDLPTNFATLQLLSAIIIGPIGAVTNRVMYKKTGSVWAGGVLAALVGMLFSVCHVIIAYV